MTSASGRMLVFGDYAVGYGNGIGETLSNLLEPLPDERLFQVHPRHTSAPLDQARGTSVPFDLPRRPGWVPDSAGLLYAPLLKAQQAAAERRVARQAASIIREHGITTVLTFPVTPWILFAAVRLRRAFPKLRFVFYVMDDWEGHHTCFGLPFTPRRRRALADMVAGSDARFACSHRMRHDYEERFGVPWQVLHKGVRLGDVAPRCHAPRAPWRILYAGGLNIFRADAVLAFVEGLRLFRERTGHLATLTLLGAGPNAQAAPEVAMHDFVSVEPWVDNDECRRRQSQADLLYLPLSMLPKVDRIANLAMPTKFSEYLASGRPVIFHVPFPSEVQDLAAGAGLPLTINSVDPEVICATLTHLDREGLDVARYHQASVALLTREFDERQLQARLLEACFGGAEPCES